MISEIEANTVNIVGNTIEIGGDFTGKRTLRDLVQAVSQFLRLGKRPCFLIIENVGENADEDELDYYRFPVPTRSWLYKMFWRDTLMSFSERGLLLCVVGDPNSALVKEGLDEVNCLINLPDLLYDSAKDEAIEDLANLYLDRGVTRVAETATALAKLHVARAQDRPRHVYAGLGATMLDLLGRH